MYDEPALIIFECYGMKLKPHQIRDISISSNYMDLSNLRRYQQLCIIGIGVSMADSIA